MPSIQVWDARHVPTGVRIRVSDGVKVAASGSTGRVGWRGIVRDIRAWVDPDEPVDDHLRDAISSMPKQAPEGSEWDDGHGRPICFFVVKGHQRYGHIRAAKVSPLPESIPAVTYTDVVESTEGEIAFCTGPPPRKADVA